MVVREYPVMLFYSRERYASRMAFARAHATRMQIHNLLYMSDAKLGKMRG